MDYVLNLKKLYANNRIDMISPSTLFAYILSLMDSPPPKHERNNWMLPYLTNKYFLVQSQR